MVFSINNTLSLRLMLTALLAIAVGACSDSETLSKRSTASGLAADKQINGGGELSDDATKGDSDNEPLPDEPNESKDNPTQSVAQKPTESGKGGGSEIKPCKYFNPAAPDFTIAKDEFGLNLPPREMPSSQIRGELQPDQKTFIGEFDLWLKAKKTASPWFLTAVGGSQLHNYAYVITNANSKDCSVSVRLVKQTGRNGGGCFAASTKIRMADGSDMMIALISEGDLVYNPVTRSNARVAEVVKGPESNKSMYEIAVGNRKVTVTSTHPFATTGGMKQAQHLVVGDRILASNGSYETISAAKKLPVSASQVVVNIRIDGDSSEDAHMIMGDGIVTGDLYLQRILENN